MSKSVRPCRDCRFWLPLGPLYTAEMGFCWNFSQQIPAVAACGAFEERDDAALYLRNEAAIGRGEPA